MARRVAVLTTGRQDFGILRSTVKALEADSEFDLLLYVAGTHLSPRHGETATILRAEGIVIAAELPFLEDKSDPAAEAGRVLGMVAAQLSEDRPDMFLLVGDRSETIAAAIAAVLSRVPVVHLHGGEESEGAVDNLFRHAVTKLSHLHLVSHPVHARRVEQMGEPPESVHVVGPPGCDNLYREDLPTRASVAEHLGVPLDPPVVLVTVHPTTLAADPGREIEAVSEAMARNPTATYVVTQPNTDAGGEDIREYWRCWSVGRANVVVTDALGETRYWGLLRCCQVVLGNSSSGIIEAPVAGVQVVNVGDRQSGRVRFGPVADTPAQIEQVSGALARALRSELSTTYPAIDPALPQGLTAPRILSALRQWTPPVLPRKRFVDMP